MQCVHFLHELMTHGIVQSHLDAIIRDGYDCDGLMK